MSRPSTYWQAQWIHSARREHVCDHRFCAIKKGDRYLAIYEVHTTELHRGFRKPVERKGHAYCTECAHWPLFWLNGARNARHRLGNEGRTAPAGIADDDKSHREVHSENTKELERMEEKLSGQTAT